MDRLRSILKNSPLVIALVYIIIGAVWIQYSDQFVLSMVDDPATITWFQSLKGWFFVIVSGLIICFLVWKNNALLSDSIDEIGKTRDKFEATFEHAPVGIAHHYPNEKWIQVNQTLCEILGYTKSELLKINFEDFIHPEDLMIGRELDRELVEKKRSSYQIEKRYRRKDGSYFDGLVQKKAVFDEKENETYLVATLEDITERKEAEQALSKTLKEKDVLLSEVHHRVRNNLALISALLDLQAMFSDNEHVNTILHDNHMRVKCLALVHESYAGTEETAHIDFGDYLGQLLEYVHHTFKNGNGINLSKKTPSLTLNINQAVPAGLLCNELLLNAYQNSFEEVKSPEINMQLIDLKEEVELTVSDNGIKKGDGYSFDPPNSLGMLIIKTLSSQLQGTIDFTEDNGRTTFRLKFKKRNLKGPSSAL